MATKKPKKETPTFEKKELPEEVTAPKKKAIKKTTKKKKPTTKKVSRAKKAELEIEAALDAVSVGEEAPEVEELEIVESEDIEENDTEDVEEDIDVLEDEEEQEDFDEEDDEEEEDEPEEATSSTEKMSKKDIDADLRDIYTDSAGEMPDMSRFSKKGRGGLFRAILVLVLSLSFLAAVAWFGFFTFEPQARFSEQDVIVSVSGVETITIGDEVRYRIKYQNDQQVPLTEARLMVRYPAGFVFESSSVPASNDANDTWDLGSIGGRDGDMIEISGRLYGDIDSEQSLRVFFNYTPSNFSSEFQKVEHASTAFEDSPVEVTVEGPEAAVTNVPEEWVFTVAPTEEAVTFEITLPDAFEMTDALPEADINNQRKWTILPDAEDRTITVQGMFTEMTEEPLVLLGTLIATVETEGDDVSYKLASLEVPVVVSDTSISVSMLVNGAYGDFSLLAGEPLNTSIFVRNNSEENIEDVSVRFVIDSPSDGSKTIFAWAQIIDEYDGSIFGEQRDADTRRATLTWTSAEVAELGSVAPGEEVVINFSLPILDAVDIDLTTFETATAAANTEVQYSVGETRETMSTDAANIMINSDLRFSQIQKITPEIDGEGMLYELTFALENNFHALTDITLEADVYGDVVVEILDIPAGEATYDTDAARLNWNVAEMPIGIDILPLQFTIMLAETNPTQTNLTSKVRIQATDSVTGERITIVGSEILLPTLEEGQDIEA